MTTYRSDRGDAIAAIAVSQQLPAYYVYDGQEIDDDDHVAVYTVASEEDRQWLRDNLQCYPQQHQALRVAALLDEMGAV
jgi:hypothetical protein